MKLDKMKPAFNLEDIVYLKTDPDQIERMVIGILFAANGLTYELKAADYDSSFHTFIEILKEKDKEKSSDID